MPNEAMSNEKVANEAVDSIDGIIHQFNVALEKCFELTANEVVFVEKDGDVSIPQMQIEVKKFADPLTDSHINFWKTLKNWLDLAFDHTKYKSLVLLTTQAYGTYTEFKDWNISETKDKLAIIVKIHSDAKKRLNSSPKQDKRNKVHELMDEILLITNRDKLTEILPKFSIACSSPMPKEQYKKLKERFLKHIPSSNRDKVMNTLLGTLLQSKSEEGHWEVDYENFSQIYQEITSKFISNTREFPKITLPINIKEVENEFHERVFILKIKDIEYEEVIDDATKEYIYANRIITEELGNRYVNKKTYDSYNEELLNIIKPKYRKACRNTDNSNIIKNSKDFYDTIISEKSPPFGNYNDTNITFKNGCIHMLIDDAEKQLHWKLNIDNNAST